MFYFRAQKQRKKRLSLWKENLLKFRIYVICFFLIFLWYKTAFKISMTFNVNKCLFLTTLHFEHESATSLFSSRPWISFWSASLFFSHGPLFFILDQAFWSSFNFRQCILRTTRKLIGLYNDFYGFCFYMAYSCPFIFHWASKLNVIGERKYAQRIEHTEIHRVITQNA